MQLYRPVCCCTPGLQQDTGRERLGCNMSESTSCQQQQYTTAQSTLALLPVPQPTELLPLLAVQCHLQCCHGQRIYAHLSVVTLQEGVCGPH